MTNRKLKIDQSMKIALQAGKKNVNIIYHAPKATVGSKPEKHDGPTQVLYALCWDLLEDGITFQEWLNLAKNVMVQASYDMADGNKSKAARLLSASRNMISEKITAISDSPTDDHICNQP